MVPTVEGEFARKRRMMSHAWPIVLRGGLLSPRGYPPLYALMVASHRLLRYATPFLHVVALVANAALLGSGWVYVVTFALQVAVLAAALAGRVIRVRPLLVARYYVLTTASMAAGLWDYLRHGTPAAGARRRARADGAPRLRRGGGRDGAAGRVAAAARSRCWPSAWSRAAAPIYRQRRVGKDGRAFDVLKLRTMVTGAERMGAGLAVSEGDTRITRVGRLLRRTSLDEVPNLVNVLRGEMAIVGPRPTVPVQVDRYTERQRGRLAVKPGITGWAQVNGRTELPWDERIELDLWYIEHRSWRLDLRILWRTARMVFGGDGLYRGEAPAWRDPPKDP